LSVYTDAGSMELFRKAIEGNEHKLVYAIQVEGTGLLIQLQGREVLTDEQIEICQKQV